MTVRTAFILGISAGVSCGCSSAETPSATSQSEETNPQEQEPAGEDTDAMTDPMSGAPSETEAPSGPSEPQEPGCADPPCDGTPDPECDPPAAEKILCVFDYDLTISANKCGETGEDDFCRQNSCGTYGWYDQCLAPAARTAIDTCIENGAYIGIASHAHVDECWDDKVLPILDQDQFPAWTESPRYSTEGEWRYPALNDRSNWNCLECAYHMDPGIDKAEGIRRVMNHYGMNYQVEADRARVIFWDDSPTNIGIVEDQLPEVRAVLVPRLNESGENGGCGITQENIIAGWAGLTPACSPSNSQ